MYSLFIVVTATVVATTTVTDPYDLYISWCESDIDANTRPYCLDCANCIETQDSCHIISQPVPMWCSSDQQVYSPPPPSLANKFICDTEPRIKNTVLNEYLTIGWMVISVISFVLNILQFILYNKYKKSIKVDSSQKNTSSSI
tara:strand:- start:374 stop:802 length:429 start_codon:yes stop_codon:yes gene_type:complete